MSPDDENIGVRPGDVLAGKYRIERVLGAGGMGIVVQARHLALDETVAIKFLRGEGWQNPETLARFAREARAAVKIKSTHVARVYDVGQLENGAPYMVMEYLEGCDLSAWLRDDGALPIEQAVEFLLQACEAIAEAHALGIVHRDLKPANLFVVRLPGGALSVKVLDFGISKAPSASDGGMTRTSAMLGSPLYMSPEQLHSSRDVDVRSDIWALGVILYELVARARPFTADTLPALTLRIAQSPPTSLLSVCPHAPPQLEAVIFKCLEKEPARRFESLSALASALLPFAPPRAHASVTRIASVLGGSASTEPRASAGSDAKGTLVATRTQANWGQTRRPRAEQRRAVVALLGFGVVGVAAALVVVRFWHTAPVAPSENSALAPIAPARDPSPVHGSNGPAMSATAEASRAVVEAPTPSPVAASAVPSPSPSAAPSSSAAQSPSLTSDTKHAPNPTPPGGAHLNQASRPQATNPQAASRPQAGSATAASPQAASPQAASPQAASPQVASRPQAPSSVTAASKPSEASPPLALPTSTAHRNSLPELINERK